MLVFATAMTRVEQQVIFSNHFGSFLTIFFLINFKGLHWQDGGEGAIYGYGMTNNFINNRMTGYMHGFWTPVKDL